MLSALKDRLGKDPRLCVALCAMYARRVIDIETQREAKIDAYRDELGRIEAQRERALQTMKRRHARAVADAELLELKQRHQVLAHAIARAVASRPNPILVKTYRDHVDELVQTFGRDTQRAETFETLRALIGSVILRPNRDRSALVVEIDKADQATESLSLSNPG